MGRCSVLGRIRESIAIADAGRTSGHPFGVLGDLHWCAYPGLRECSLRSHSLHPGLSWGRAVGTGRHRRVTLAGHGTVLGVGADSRIHRDLCGPTSNIGPPLRGFGRPALGRLPRVSRMLATLPFAAPWAIMGPCRWHWAASRRDPGRTWDGPRYRGEFANPSRHARSTSNIGPPLRGLWAIGIGTSLPRVSRMLAALTFAALPFVAPWAIIGPCLRYLDEFEDPSWIMDVTSISGLRLPPDWCHRAAHVKTKTARGRVRPTSSIRGVMPTNRSP